MDRRAQVLGELAADAVLRGVRQDNGPDALVLLKSDRRHFSHSPCEGLLLSESGDIDCALKLRIGQQTVPTGERHDSQ
jgi:hypothetical protein